MQPFEQKIWLSPPTINGEKLEYMTEAYEINQMFTVGLYFSSPLKD